MKLKRRDFLQYVGAGTASIFFESKGLALPSSEQKVRRPSFLTKFNSPPSCIPLPGDGGSAETDASQFGTFSVSDDFLIPKDYFLKQIVSWGDVLGDKSHEIKIGYNCDHLSLLRHSKNLNEYFLVINHEYVSNVPWSQSLKTILGEEIPELEMTDGEDFRRLHESDMILPLFPNANLSRYPELSKKLQTIAEKTLREMGVSIVHLKAVNGELEVVKNSSVHRRISTVESQNISSGIKFSFRGPGSALLPSPRGTLANCSGATTPWNTAMTCEENIQDAAPEWVTPSGEELEKVKFKIDGVMVGKKKGLPLEWTGLGTCIENPIDNRTYGWVGEIIPETGELKKYTSLGRFRHENVTFSAKTGEKLRLYMGDDRRGGHVWRYESLEVAKDPTLQSTSALLEKGELCCAKFNPDFSGSWIPLNASTRLIVPDPDKVSEGYLFLPSRPNGGPVLITNREIKEVKKLLRSQVEYLTPEAWVKQIESYCKKPFSEVRLGDLVAGDTPDKKQLVLLMDAFLMANAVGGTPSARPEDLEVHPFDNSIYIAFTDNTGKEHGSPDIEIFPDSKRVNSRQYGAVYRIEENSDSSKFSWGKFISSGEVAESGAGFACVDNLAFDRDGNLWFVCDISIDSQNHSVDGGAREAEGEKYFPGIFGNSNMFVVPTSGEHKGIPKLFAIGPVESEITGIKFYEDENLDEFLLVSIQHPGELNGIGKGIVEERTMQIKTRAGQTFKQVRIIPIGSNFPDGLGHAPKPTVFAVYRKL